MKLVSLLLPGVLAFSSPSLHAQGVPQAIGSVAFADATVTSSDRQIVEVNGGRAELTGSSTVTAKSRTAEVALTRGGNVRVCPTSGLHLAQSADTSLLLALDRGAMEIHMKANATDIVMTPDLRFVMAGSGPLDLRMRVTRNGDTCVENRGRKAPALNISDVFGDATYQVKPGQHVLFEHGSLREVVDRETTPCGCPEKEKPGVPIADALLHGGSGTVTPKQAETSHPFPAAVSDGLVQPTPVPAEAPGGTHVQVASSLNYDGADSTAGAPKTVSAPPPQAATQATSPVEPAPQAKHGPLRSIGHFFRRLFAR